MTDKVREEFEAAYVEDMVRIMGEGIRRRATENTKFLMQNGEFQDPALRLALWAWKASRDLLPAAYTTVDMTTAATDGFRDGAASAQALRKALSECTASLEGEMLQKYHGKKPEDMHPVTRRDYDRDMEEIEGYKAIATASAE